MSLNTDELVRYSRHLTLPEVGKKGQENLKSAKVLVVGCGGLGCPALTYLVAAGIGTIGIIDFDVVDVSNLQRQVLFSTADVGKLKVEVAKERLLLSNPNVTIHTYAEALTSNNALEIFSLYDIIVDGTDNFATRYLVNDACVLTGKPNVYGSIFRFEGQVTVFNYEGGPNYRCLYKEPPPPGLVPSCAEGGVLGVLPGVVACLQVTEALKMILDVGDIASGKLLIYDALRFSFRQLDIKKRFDYEIKELIDYESFCGVSKNEDVSEMDEITVEELATYFDQHKSFTLIDVREPFEHEIVNIKEAKLIPLGEFEDSISSMNKSEHYVIYCKVGGRSATATQYMLSKGFTNVQNLKGGILDWVKKINTDLPTY